MSNLFGNKLKLLWEEKQIYRSQLAVELVDTANHCIIEKDFRRAKLKQVIEFADIIKAYLEEFVKLLPSIKIKKVALAKNEKIETVSIKVIYKSISYKLSWLLNL